ncbi:MAG: hypothetical protein M1816_005050 [Peltula sp. TS41687]|nr:MAG: hypothetical protein M1816_005050 [Peltula sp. TS41687]
MGRPPGNWVRIPGWIKAGLRLRENTLGSLARTARRSFNYDRPRQNHTGVCALVGMGKRVWRRAPSPPRTFSKFQFHSISSEELVEEETLPFYKHEEYYPVRIGEVFNARYQVIGKLGYGAYSTVWLGRDLSENRYVALKVSTYLQKAPEWGRRELKVYEHLSKIDSSHPGQGFIHESMLEDFEKAELEDPSPQKIVDEARTIYLSRRFREPRDSDYGYPVLCDFGEARIGKVQQTGPFIQLHPYRAPEIWDLFEGEHLFHHIKDKEGKHDPFKHLAQMAGFLGLPPKEFLLRSETTSQCFNSEGKWIAGEYVKIPVTSLAKVETRLQGQDKELFLRFIRSMLQWLPEERKTAKELLDDPWLNKPLD